MFELPPDAESGATRRNRGPAAVKIEKLWLTIFTSALSAIVLGGLILGLGLRLYVHWSVADTAKQINESQKRGHSE